MVKLPLNTNYLRAFKLRVVTTYNSIKQSYTCIKVIQERLTNNKDTVLYLHQSDTRKGTQRTTTQNPKKLFLEWRLEW